MANDILFKKKTLPDIFEDIYKTSKNKDKQLTALIAQLTSFATDKETASNIIPLLKDYFELQIKNDDSVIKMARIAQLYLKDEKLGELVGDDYNDLMKEADAILKHQDEEKKVTLNIDINSIGDVNQLIEEGKV